MEFDFSKLRGRIVEIFGSGGNKLYAQALGITPETLSRKLNNKANFTISEMAKSISILRIENEPIQNYFFKYKVKPF